VKDAVAVMPAATAKVYAHLRHNPLLQSFVLIGGTALALHLGHRKSEDLDYVTLHPRLPRAALDELVRHLQRNGFSIAPNDDPAAYDDFLEAGLDLGDYQRNLLINGAVKVTFFTSDAEMGRLLDTRPEQAISGARVATVPELSRLKALVASKRSSSRDWLDLYVLARDHGFSIAKWKHAYDLAGLGSLDFETALNRVCSGKLPTNDPGFATLLEEGPSIAEISSYFSRLRSDYERTVAQAALKSHEERP
jgi:hypothetical protein